MSEQVDKDHTQPMPVVNDEEFIQDLVMKDLEERKQMGIRKYGTALQPFNGRDALKDAYEECLDQAVYLKQAMVERDRLMEKSPQEEDKQKFGKMLAQIQSGEMK